MWYFDDGNVGFFIDKTEAKIIVLQSVNRLSLLLPLLRPGSLFVPMFSMQTIAKELFSIQTHTHTTIIYPIILLCTSQLYYMKSHRNTTCVSVQVCDVQNKLRSRLIGPSDVVL